MKILFSILGEGRGHMTQAMAAREILERAGHHVVLSVLGMSKNRQVPAFFASAMTMPVVRISTIDFAFKDNRKVSLPATLCRLATRLPQHWRAVRSLRKLVRQTKPDVIVNFFEPITALYALTTRNRPPVVAIGHQFMCGHPDYVRAPGMRMQQAGLNWYVRFMGAASTKLALSFYQAPDRPEANLTVSPPLLRRSLFDLEPRANGDFVLVYLLNHGYASQIIQWHMRNPRVSLHCFYDKPSAPAEQRVDATLTFHRLDGDKFLRMMANCKHVVCTAGFESVSEAVYLGKPLFMVPVENHVEQSLNAIDATRAGFGITDTFFNLDRLSELPDTLSGTDFRAWLRRAESLLLQTVERVARTAAEPLRIFPLDAKETTAS